MVSVPSCLRVPRYLGVHSLTLGEELSLDDGKLKIWTGAAAHDEVEHEPARARRPVIPHFPLRERRGLGVALGVVALGEGSLARRDVRWRGSRRCAERTYSKI